MKIIFLLLTLVLLVGCSPNIKQISLGEVKCEYDDNVGLGLCIGLVGSFDYKIVETTTKYETDYQENIIKILVAENGEIQPLKTFTFNFSISDDDNCSSFLYSEESVMTTNKYGQIETTFKLFYNKYLCYYRDGILRDVIKLVADEDVSYLLVK